MNYRFQAICPTVGRMERDDCGRPRRRSFPIELRAARPRLLALLTLLLLAGPRTPAQTGTQTSAAGIGKAASPVSQGFSAVPSANPALATPERPGPGAGTNTEPARPTTGLGIPRSVDISIA